MCGILGIFSPNHELPSNTADALVKGLEVQAHRGPDYSDLWADRYIAIGHNKLSILDFTNLSNQPVYYKDRLVLCFNGEIYNYRDLQQKYSLKFGIDVHIIAELYLMKGMAFLDEIEGDFAIAIYDLRSATLYLCRDRMGVKPLLYHYSAQDKTVVFASEAKAMAPLGVDLKPNYSRIITDLVMWFWADKLATYFQDVYNVRPGTYLRFDTSGVTEICYWDMARSRCEGCTAADVKKRLIYATDARMMGQAPIVSILSGGLDSSLLTAIASREVDRLPAITIRYDDDQNNVDFFFAQMLAEKCGNIQFIENRICAEETTIQEIDHACYHIEEVIWDKVYLSQYRNYACAAKNGLRVAINGQGSDEVWLGYYYDFPQYHFSHMEDFAPDNLYNLFLQENLGGEYRLSEAAKAIYRDAIHLTVKNDIPPDWPVLDSMTYWAVKTYLISNMMQEDRMSMASSVECRVPFTDHRLLDLALSFPASQKVHNGIEKFIVKQIGYDLLPHDIPNRRKQAFVNPEHQYNAAAFAYFSQHLQEICSSPFFRFTFSHQFLQELQNPDSFQSINPELIFKLVAIHRFMAVFGGDFR